MKEKEKIELLGKLYKKYGNSKSKSIFRLSEDSENKGDSDLEAIDFEEWKNFIIWGNELDLFFKLTNKYNQVILTDRVGLFLEEFLEEKKNERMRIENDRLRLLFQADDRCNREISSISGVPYECLYPNNSNNPINKKDIKVVVDTGGGDYINTGGGDVCKGNKSLLGDIRMQKTIFINKIKEKSWRWWVVGFGGFIISLLIFLILIF